MADHQPQQLVGSSGDGSRRSPVPDTALYSTESLLDDPVLNPRKRPRSASPQPARSTTTTTTSSRSRTQRSAARQATSSSSSSNHKANDSAPLAAKLKDPTKRTETLNELLQITASHDINYALGRHGDQLLDQLAAIFQDCLDWKPQAFASSSSSSTTTIKMTSKSTWDGPPTESQRRWIQHAQEKLRHLSQEQSAVLHTLLIILRNLSFVAANGRCMVYSSATLNILQASLYEDHTNPYVRGEGGGSGGADSSSSVLAQSHGSTPQHFNLALHALHTLVNLAPYFDITGQSLLCDQLFLSPSLRQTLLQSATTATSSSSSSSTTTTELSELGWGGMRLAKLFDAREDALDVEAASDDDDHWTIRQVQHHVEHMHGLFSAIRHVLTSSTSPRSNVLMAMDLLSEWLECHTGGMMVLPKEETKDKDEHDKQSPNHNNNKNRVLHMAWVLRDLPDDVLQRLVDFLWIPRLGPDALDYINPVTHVVSRVSTLKLLMGYDATVDTELRDRALDVLVSWTGLQSNSGGSGSGGGGALAAARRLVVDPKTGRTRARLFRALVPALTTRVGRNEAALLASQLFRSLSSSIGVAEREGLEYVQEQLLELASRDARIAQLALTHLYAPVTDKKKKTKKKNTSESSGGEEEVDDDEEDDNEDEKMEEDNDDEE